MAALNWIALLLTHPLEFKTLLQFWLYHESKRDIAAVKEHPTSGWNRQSMQTCWKFLDMTSRSFSAVIKELDGDLARTVHYPQFSRATRAAHIIFYYIFSIITYGSLTEPSFNRWRFFISFFVVLIPLKMI